MEKPHLTYWFSSPNEEIRLPSDPSFEIDRNALLRGIELMTEAMLRGSETLVPDRLPDHGVGDLHALERLAPQVLGGAAYLDGPNALAHMDPPTPWITWITTLWNARLNQNLLHPATAPFAREAERRVIAWLAPFYGMDGGHMVPGSTLANLTAIWAARECAGVKKVVASSAAHLSVRKAASMLGLDFVSVATDETQQLDVNDLPTDLSDACLVLTAGTTSVGAIDPLALTGRARWTHVDAAWAGPLRLSDRYAHLLDGVDRADSLAISAHKWFFQPKESGLVFFRNTAEANRGIAFGGDYLAQPNVGVLGSHGANAVPLLATLLAWGKAGLAERIERCMEIAVTLETRLRAGPFQLFAPARTGIVVFRPTHAATKDVAQKLPQETASSTTIDGEPWLRCVAANPNADVEAIVRLILAAAS